MRLSGEIMRNRSNSQAASPSAAGDSYPSLGPYQGVALERHKARCRICRHPRREEIEEDFLDWSSPRELAETYQLPDFRAIYRHATAVGLFDRRRRNIQRATDRIIERVADVDVNAWAVVAAIRITLNEERKWLDLVHRLIHEDLRGEPPATPEQTEARSMPERFRAGLASSDSQPPREFQEPEQSRGPEKSSIDRPAADRAPAEAVPEEEEREKSSAASESRVVVSENRPADAAQEPARPAEAQSPADPYNAPGQVAGIPWPWPAKKILFSRRRGWRPTRPG
jgi:hypothetical protein